MEQNLELKAERDYLDETKTLLYSKLSEIEEKLAETKTDVNEMVSQISREFNSLDGADRATIMMDMDREDSAIYELICKKQILQKMKQSPYFGRIDFQPDDLDEINQIYIGIANLQEARKDAIPKVCDWRAPISSMYYDYEVGEASYDAPIGKIYGEITRKRQYKVKDGNLEYFFDSNVTIGDEILKEALSHSTSDKMKNIVSTIQKQQNAIIRSDINRTLVVQGVAGSGKTSIALHRIAFLLYRYKEKIKARNILILSPNKIFSDYISNVLPELGEQNVMEITFGELAFDELRGICPFEDRASMTDDVLSGNKKRAKEIAIKGSFEFRDALVSYLENEVSLLFQPEDIAVGEYLVTKERISDLYNLRYKSKDVSKRIEWIADYVASELGATPSNVRGLTSRVKLRLYKMFKSTDIISLYEKFLSSLGLMLEYTGKGALRYEDVSSVLLIKDYLLGINTFKETKYLLVDEMQDYDPVAVMLINKMFTCPKTVLGDIYQTFEKNLDEQFLDKFTAAFGDASFLLKINKSYRSTFEIAQCSQAFIDLKGADNVSRHGEKPAMITSANEDEMIKKIAESANQMTSNGYTRVAVICKHQKMAEKLYKKLSKITKCNLVEKNSTAVYSGIIVVSCALSKGLEFDGVIVPYAQDDEYDSKYYNNCLYIASSRALHTLEFYSIGEISSLIQDAIAKIEE